jgi:hypothetical protein
MNAEGIYILAAEVRCQNISVGAKEICLSLQKMNKLQMLLYESF